jgi:tetratricopeptide (TPR) repeat protein
LGHDTEAVSTAQAALKLESHRADAYLVLASVASRRKQLDAVTRYCKSGLEVSPGDDSLYYLLFETVETTGRYAEAVPLLAAYVVRHPDDYWARRNLAYALFRSRDYRRSIAEFEAALSIDPLRNAETHMEAGDVYAKLGLFEKAAERYRRASYMHGGSLKKEALQRLAKLNQARR